jgi:hypothetical protein
MTEHRLVALGRCFTCGQPFSFDPDTVPSVLIDPTTNLPPDIGHTDPADAVKQPVCPTCVTQVNAVRRSEGKAAAWRQP